MTTSDGFLHFLSAAFGWIYFLAWSLSFYPQSILNWRRQTTAGTTVDFPFINVLGFTAYFVSTVAFYYSPVVRSQYAARHNGLSPTVEFNDIMFALNGVIMSVVVTSQYLFAKSLWGFPPSAGSRPSRFILGVAAGCIVGVAFTCFLVAGPGSDPLTDWVALDIVYAIGYVKLIITIIKYTPQVIFNYNNKSTEGWSIQQILLDLTGGFLSVAQQGIDSYLQRDWSGITGNPVKFALGNVSIMYDLIFVVQHFVLYRGAKLRETEENDRLLANDEERRID